MRPIALTMVFALWFSAPAGALSLKELQYLEDPNTHAILHAAPARKADSDRNARNDECSPRDDLTGPGRLVAAAVGQTIQKAGTRIDHVLSGPACNSVVTARLLKLVPVDVTDFLASEPAVGQTAEDQRDDAIFYLAGLRELETALLVTHGQNIAMLTGRETVPGELLIVTVSPLGALDVRFSILP